jgi:hypothetical protein
LLLWDQNSEAAGVGVKCGEKMEKNGQGRKEKNQKAIPNFTNCKYTKYFSCKSTSTSVATPQALLLQQKNLQLQLLKKALQLQLVLL